MGGPFLWWDTHPRNGTLKWVNAWLREDTRASTRAHRVKANKEKKRLQTARWLNEKKRESCSSEWRHCQCTSRSNMIRDFEGGGKDSCSRKNRVADMGNAGEMIRKWGLCRQAPSHLVLHWQHYVEESFPQWLRAHRLRWHCFVLRRRWGSRGSVSSRCLC